MGGEEIRDLVGLPSKRLSSDWETTRVCPSSSSSSELLVQPDDEGDPVSSTSEPISDDDDDEFDSELSVLYIAIAAESEVACVCASCAVERRLTMPLTVGVMEVGGGAGA